ncbi:MAG: hypothetical protein LBN34_04105 [Clostridiales Family XIII bacterium]|jgi:hypothetical protein|nr:hypothetical protein [Clostridiales Family XIII bacterium]
MLKPDSRKKSISAKLREENVLAIKQYIQGLVYGYSIANPDNYFYSRDLVGGDNYLWEGTPLECLYYSHRVNGKSNEKAIKAAGNDFGLLLADVLREDIRTFIAADGDRAKKYKREKPEEDKHFNENKDNSWIKFV